jgi:hypothetical protein
VLSNVTYNFSILIILQQLINGNMGDFKIPIGTERFEEGKSEHFEMKELLLESREIEKEWRNLMKGRNCIAIQRY